MRRAPPRSYPASLQRPGGSGVSDPSYKKYPHPKPPTSGDAATVADRRSPRTRGLSLITGPQMREQNHIANRFRTGQHHDQSIDPETQPARTRHSMLKSQQKFFI